MDKLYKQFCSIKNLELAWSRLKTTQDLSYRNYYRNLFLGYELSKKQNIKNLHERLSGYSYKPYKVLRIYKPKSTGLHRPIIFLSLDDQIVYQAFCNIIAEKFSKKRQEIELISVFSNILNRDEDKPVFFLKKWQEGYLKFRKKIISYYNDGFKWVAHFDLAAYFDTICHNSFCKQISKNSHEDFCKFIKTCLVIWCSEKQHLTHGIPQGPMASNFIGEIYLLPIDKSLLKNRIKYVRYVDDIKIFGASREEVLEGVILLEKECKERGLIPQSKKFEIIESASFEEAIGKNPSMTYQFKQSINLNKKETAQVFKEAFDSKKIDISKVRYILKSSEKNDEILHIVLDNLNKHPELVDEFCLFIKNYIDLSGIAKLIFKKALKNPSPYEYVEGQYWDLLSKFKIIKFSNTYIYNKLKGSQNKPALRIGLYKFISRSSNGEMFLKWLVNEKYSLVQMMLAEYIEPNLYDNPLYWKLIDKLLQRNIYDPCLACIKEMKFNFRDDLIKKIKPKRDDSNVLSNIIGSSENIDSVGQILKNRYSISYSKIWQKLFCKGKEYKHANNILYYADIAYFNDKNTWVNYTDSFNDMLIRCFIKYLEKKYPTDRWPESKDSKGKNNDFGKLLDKNNKLSLNYPNIIDGIREFHKRRSKVPTSHAFDKDTGDRTTYISGGEQKNLSNKLSKCYNELISVCK